MSWRYNLPQVIVLHMELAGVIVHQVRRQLDVVLHDAEATEVLLDERFLDEVGVLDDLPDVRPLQDAVIRCFDMATLGGLLELFRLANDASTAGTTGVMVVVVILLCLLPTVLAFEAEALNVVIVDQALNNTIGEASVAKILETRQEMELVAFTPQTRVICRGQIFAGIE